MTTTATGIQEGLALLLEPGSVAEARILNTPKATVSGYFMDLDKLAVAIAAWDGKAPAIYVTLNPVTRDLLARSMNRLREYARETTQDQDILCRRWFLLDWDPVRPSGISSTDPEHGAALARAREVRDWLAGGGWPDPVLIDSGNGAHLLYRVTLPNTPDALQLVIRCLEALAFRFNDEKVELDLKVGNAARICKVPGTMACKGDHTPDRPHRRSRILEVPDRLIVVPVDLLEGLAAEAPRADNNGHRSGPVGTFNLDAWLAAHPLNIVVSGAWNGGRRRVLNPCPWDADHTNRAAYIVQHASGAIAAGCHHNGCAGKDWHALRDLMEPGWRARREERKPSGDGHAARPEAEPIRLCSVVEVLRLTRSDSQRIPTRIPGLDPLLRGGIPARRLILAGGTTAAGKTALVLQVAEAHTEAGGVVVVVPYDEGAEPACVRVGQQHGYIREQIEERLETLLDTLDRELTGKILRLPDPTAHADPTIEDGAEAVAALVREHPGAPGLLIVDSIQRAHTRVSDAARSERERITDNVQIARRVAVEHNIAVLATSETNRGFYRAKREEDRVRDEAAFAEARAEYWVDVALTMRARDDESDLIDIRVAKNRLGDRTPMVLRLDRARARLVEVDKETSAKGKEATEDEAIQKAIERILRALKKTPDLNRKQLSQVVGGKTSVFSEALNQAKDKELVTWRKEGSEILQRLTEVPK